MKIKLIIAGTSILAAGIAGFYAVNNSVNSSDFESSSITQEENVEKKKGQLKTDLNESKKSSAIASKTTDIKAKAKRIKVSEDLYKNVNAEDDYIRLNDTERSESLNDLYFKASYRRLKDQHKVLFRRLNLTEEEDLRLAKLLHEKGAVKNLNPRYLINPNLSDKEEQKAEYERLESEMGNLTKSLDTEIEELLGEDYATYEQYTELQKEYWQLSRVEGIGAQDKNDLVFNNDEQDELAQYMHDSYQDFNTEKRGWERAIRESKESAYEFLNEMENLNKNLIAEAPANETQKQALRVLYKGQYEHFRRMVHKIYPAK